PARARRTRGGRGRRREAGDQGGGEALQLGQAVAEGGAARRPPGRADRAGGGEAARGRGGAGRPGGLVDAGEGEAGRAPPPAREACGGRALRELGGGRGRELGRGREGLKDDAVALGQLQQRRQLLLVGVGLQLEGEADRGE